MKALTLTTLIGLTALSSGAALADDHMGADFTSHSAVTEKPYAEEADALPADDKLELREYTDYELREPCQNYRPIPQGFVKDGCDIVPATEGVTYVPVAREVLADYIVNFDFDKSDITSKASMTLDKVAAEIKKYRPGEVTVEGHTDTSGSMSYNQGLSHDRAMAVSDALTARGVEHRVIDKEAYGETKPAVNTGDGVMLEANRRVVIEFLK